MTRKMLATLVVTAVSAVDAPAANAEVTATGEMELLDPPPASVMHGDTENDEVLLAFREHDEPVELPTDVAVDTDGAGTWNDPGDFADAEVPAGTSVRTYFVHFDPPGEDIVHLVGGLRFDERVLGVSLISAHLDASDSTLGRDGTDYPTGLDLRGVELHESDELEISTDEHEVHFDLEASISVDQARVLTAARASDPDGGVASDAGADGRDAGPVIADGGEKPSTHRERYTGGGGCTAGPHPGPQPGAAAIVLVVATGWLHRRTRLSDQARRSHRRVPVDYGSSARTRPRCRSIRTPRGEHHLRTCVP